MTLDLIARLGEIEQAVEGLFIAPDAHDDLTVWNGDPDFPTALVRKPEVSAEVWTLLESVVPVQEPEPRYCAEQTARATHLDPPEWCEEEAVEGSDYCERHLPYEPDPDRAWKERHE